MKKIISENENEFVAIVNGFHAITLKVEEYQKRNNPHDVFQFREIYRNNVEYARAGKYQSSYGSVPFTL